VVERWAENPKVACSIHVRHMGDIYPKGFSKMNLPDYNVFNTFVNIFL